MDREGKQITKLYELLNTINAIYSASCYIFFISLHLLFQKSLYRNPFVYVSADMVKVKSSSHNTRDVACVFVSVIVCALKSIFSWQL